MSSWSKLNPTEKASILSKEGDYITSIEYYGKVWILYAYEFEYWEVVYDPLENEIVEVHTPSKGKLNLYITKVSISDIIT